MKCIAIRKDEMLPAICSAVCLAEGRTEEALGEDFIFIVTGRNRSA